MESFWAQKRKNTKVSQNFQQIFIAIYLTTVIEKEENFRVSMIIPKEPRFGRFWGKNWFASYFLFQCFAFPNSFLFRTGDPLLLRSCSGTWVTSILRLGEFFTQFFQLILSFPPAASWIRTQFETPDVMEQTPEEKRRLLARLIRSTQYVNLFWDKTVFFMETRLLNVGMLHFENLIFIVKLIMLLPERL